MKDDQGNIVSARLVNRQGQRALPLPLPILSLYANPKDVSSCDLFHRINPSQTLEIRATRFDSIPFIFPYVSVRVCSRERGRDSRLISRIENEKKGKEQGDLGKKKIWIFAVYFYTKENRYTRNLINMDAKENVFFPPKGFLSYFRNLANVDFR